MNDFSQMYLDVMAEEMPLLREEANLAPFIHQYKIQDTKYADVPITGNIPLQEDFNADTTVNDASMTTKRLTINKRKRYAFKVRRIDQAFTAHDLKTSLIRPGVKKIVLARDADVGELQAQITTNRIGTLGAGFSRPLITEAKKKLKKYDVTPEYLAICPESEEDINNDDELAKIYATQSAASVQTGKLPMLHGCKTLVSNKVYSPATDQSCDLMFARQFAGIAHANLNKLKDYYNGNAVEFVDTKSGLVIYFIVEVDKDGVTFVLDAAWGLIVADERLACVIQT